MTDTLHQRETQEVIAADRQRVGVEEAEPDAAEPDDVEDNWRDDPCIVCTEQPAIKVYSNPYGQAVIRQERRWDEDGDPIIFVSPEYAIAVAHAILAAAGKGDVEFTQSCGGGFVDVEIPPRAGEQFGKRKSKRGAR
jgi:hypothetical protein